MPPRPGSTPSRTAGTWLGTWLITRVGLLGLLVLRGGPVVGDLRYFERSLTGVGPTGYADVMPEYPTPATLLLGLLHDLATGMGADTLRPALFAAVLGGDALLTAALVRRGDRFGVGVWVWGVVLVGPLAYARLDLLPGVLVAGALLAGAHRARAVGAMVAVATGLKLWPVVVLPVLLARSRSPRLVLLTGAGTGTALVVASVVAGGWHRLLTPLGYQHDRGLQVESVAATPAMLARLVAGDRFDVARSAYLAFEVAGPGTSLLITLSTLLTATWVAGVALLGVRLWHAGSRPTPDAVAWLLLACIAGGVATNKVLSPQYLLWLLPAAAAAAALSPADRQLRRWCVVLLLTCALTQVVFPELYHGLTGLGTLTLPATLVLTARNVLLVWLAVTAWRIAAVRLGSISGAAADGSRTSLRRGPTGTDEPLTERDDGLPELRR